MGVGDGRADRVWAVLETVHDPELPFLSVVDLGVVGQVAVEDDGQRVRVGITPTYSGCPALEVIEAQVDQALSLAGFSVRIERQLSPAWTTDRITERGRQLLFEHGVAPPGPVSELVALRVPVPCPRCQSKDTEELSAFGSTACKSLWRCRACREPFDHFKPQ